MENKKLSEIQVESIDVVFEEVNSLHQTIDSQLLSNQSKMGVQVQSVFVPKGFNFGLKSEKETLDWLCKTVQNEFYASRVLFLKYNPEGKREDWQNNKATNRRYLETKNLYKRGLYHNKLFIKND